MWLSCRRVLAGKIYNFAPYRNSGVKAEQHEITNLFWCVNVLFTERYHPRRPENCFRLKSNRWKITSWSLMAWITKKMNLKIFMRNDARHQKNYFESFKVSTRPRPRQYFFQLQPNSSWSFNFALGAKILLKTRANQIYLRVSSATIGHSFLLLVLILRFWDSVSKQEDSQNHSV